MKIQYTIQTESDYKDEEYDVSPHVSNVAVICDHRDFKTVNLGRQITQPVQIGIQTVDKNQRLLGCYFTVRLEFRNSRPKLFVETKINNRVVKKEITGVMQ